MGKLGQLLVARGWITVQQLTRALQNQNAVGGRLGTCLLEMDGIGEDLLVRSLSEQLGVPAATADELRGIAPEVLNLIPERLARRCRAIAFRMAGGRLDVAMQDPRNLACQDEIAFACGKRVKVHVAPEVRIFEALEKYYAEECPSRYSLLLDRLNRARFLWERVHPSAPPQSVSGPVLTPLDDLLGPAVRLTAPPMLPDAELPPIQARRPPRDQPPPQSTAGAEANTAPGLDGGGRPALLPPLPEIELRRSSRRGPPQELPATAPAAPPPGAGSAWRGPAPAPAAPARPAAAAPSPQPPAPAAPSPPPLPVSAAPSPPPNPAWAAQSQPPASHSPVPESNPDATMPSEIGLGSAPVRQVVLLTDRERAELGGNDLARDAAPLAPAVSPPLTGPVARDVPTTFEELETAFTATRDSEEIGRLLLGYLANEYRRVALFQVTREHAAGWMAQGENIDQQAFSRFSVGFDEPSIFLNLRQGSSLYLGPLPPMAAHRELSLTWGGGLPRDCVVLPVWLRDRLVTVIYADGAAHGLAGLDLERLRRVTAATAAAFERCIRSRRRAGTSV